MIDVSPLTFLDKHPIIIAIAGPNGAGKTTFFHSHLASSGLLFINADIIAHDLDTDPYAAARLADSLRGAMVDRGESFIFETVFSDPVGEKIAFLERAVAGGYTVLMCFIGISNTAQSVERVAMRVSQGGHDVTDSKLASRFPRILRNLELAVSRLPYVFVYDNSDLNFPYRQVAVFERSCLPASSEPIPEWLRPLLP